MGAVFGFLGGLIGTYFSIHNTKTPAERRFMVWAAVGTWLGIFLFLAILLHLPTAWRWVAWCFYSVLIVVSVPWINRHQKALRGSDR